MKTFQEKYNGTFREVYNLMLNNYPPDLTDDFWESYGVQADTLAKKYGNDLFIRGLILAITNELEREAKK